MEDTIQRIERILDLYGSNKTTLSHKIGMPQSTLSSIFSRKNAKSVRSVADAMLAIYADVRPDWLLYGQEPMLKSQLEQNGFSDLHKIIRNLSETVRMQQETINKLTQRKKTDSAIATVA